MWSIAIFIDKTKLKCIYEKNFWLIVNWFIFKLKTNLLWLWIEFIANGQEVEVDVDNATPRPGHGCGRGPGRGFFRRFFTRNRGGGVGNGGPDSGVGLDGKDNGDKEVETFWYDFRKNLNNNNYRLKNHYISKFWFK